MVSREIWEKHALMSFSKTHKLHSSFGLVQFCTFLKNSLVHVFPKLHSKPYYYLYLLTLGAFQAVTKLHYKLLYYLYDYSYSYYYIYDVRDFKCCPKTLIPGILSQ